MFKLSVKEYNTKYIQDLSDIISNCTFSILSNLNFKIHSTGFQGKGNGIGTFKSTLAPFECSFFKELPHNEFTNNLFNGWSNGIISNLNDIKFIVYSNIIGFGMGIGITDTFKKPDLAKEIEEKGFIHDFSQLISRAYLDGLYSFIQSGFLYVVYDNESENIKREEIALKRVEICLK
ncbi:MAG: hypothetical protein WC783_00630 [Candidatus Paceibacterota bacterium]|jgi:hypothetical protein